MADVRRTPGCIRRARSDRARTCEDGTMTSDVQQDHETEQWGADGFFFTEAARGGPLTWRRGAAALEGDALGPVRHVHDDAAEYFYMHRGSLRIEACGEEFVLAEGQLCLIPPDAPHNVLGLAS